MAAAQQEQQLTATLRTKLAHVQSLLEERRSAQHSTEQELALCTDARALAARAWQHALIAACGAAVRRHVARLNPQEAREQWALHAGMAQAALQQLLLDVGAQVRVSVRPCGRSNVRMCKRAACGAAAARGDSAAATAGAEPRALPPAAPRAGRPAGRPPRFRAGAYARRCRERWPKV